VFVAGHGTTLIVATLAGGRVSAIAVDVVIALSVPFVGGHPRHRRWVTLAIKHRELDDFFHIAGLTVHAANAIGGPSAWFAGAGRGAQRTGGSESAWRAPACDDKRPRTRERPFGRHRTRRGQQRRHAGEQTDQRRPYDAPLRLHPPRPEA